MFDGILGNYTCSELKIDLLDGAKPYHAKPFSFPKVQEETIKLKLID